jgi:hypothetical protein
MRVHERVALQPVLLAPRILEEGRGGLERALWGLARLVVVDCSFSLVLCALYLFVL